MNYLLTILISAVVAVGAAFFTPETPQSQIGGVLPIAGVTYNLAGSGVSGSATSITLQSLTLPQTDQELVDSDFSDTFYLTLEPGNRTKQEIVSCTTVAQSGTNDTATLSGCTRGLSPITPYTASTTLQFTHAGGSQVIFSDPPQLFNQYAAKSNAETISNTWTFGSTTPPRLDGHATTTGNMFATAAMLFNDYLSLGTTTPQNIYGIKTFNATTTLSSGALVSTAYRCTPSSDSNQLCDKAYVDAVGSSGAANANSTTKGIVEEATVAEINSGAETGDTGAKLFFTPSSFALSNYASTTASSTPTASQVQTFYDIAVRAGTTILAWGKTVKDAPCVTTKEVATLTLKQSTFAATTTIDTTSLKGATSADECGLSVFGSFTATTTETVNLQMSHEDAQTKLMYLRIN